MNYFSNYFLSYRKIEDILKEIKLNNRIEISEASRETASLISLCLHDTSDENIVLIAPNIFQAQLLYDELSNMVEDCFFYPKDDFVSAELLAESFDFKLQRIQALKNIFQNKKKKIIIAPLAALLSRVPDRKSYESKIMTFKVNNSYKPKDLAKTLVDAGYEMTYTVEKQGEVSLRGSILDIFPINETNAYRLDFFGNDIETIKILDIESQRSIGIVDSLVVMPRAEIIFSDDEKETIKFYISDRLEEEDLDDKTKTKLEEDLEHLSEFADYTLLSKYLYIFNKNNYSFIDYIDNKTVIFFDYKFIKNQEENIANQIYDYLSNFKDYFTTGSYLNDLSTYHFEREVYIDPERYFRNLDKITLSSNTINDYENRFDVLTKELLAKSPTETVIISSTKENTEIIKAALETGMVPYVCVNSDIERGKINIIEDVSSFPIDIPEIELRIITDSKIFKSFRNSKSRYALAVETKRLKSVSELKIGDYVVHYKYGIGEFTEITTLTLKNHTNDYIHIKYDQEQSVYIPVENISMLSKYAGSEDYKPKLSNLNSKEWEKAKESARKKAADIADKLLALYTEREKAEGFKYLPDDDIQKDFETSFKYDLTKDQAQAIDDVKKDMESGKPMDRLICGDVGFGKTEVALRAALKAVLSGKQVAYLAPTTILARQHYHTFKDRLDKYGVEVRMVSRFVDQKTIKKNLKDLTRGTVDIIIGTHRLLSKDVEFKNLGLIIVDEEQRFGVEAKEKLKEMKTNADCLTLTATPIPRTLQMAITGIKSISLIETAPKGRYPVQTYVMKRNNYVVKDAIEKEISKGGQVFYLYNRVEDIDKIVTYVHGLVPEARILVIHGKMEKDEMEDTIQSFINRQADILISTTIIETGVDIPNANTLIIHDAERYGLSQLYQIKGRVGRSNIISYAYLMYDEDKELKPDAKKRLKAIKDFAELGSGFKIAVRDLTTRGAGEILGREQSGFMDKVGIDLYLKILDEEIKKKKGEEVKDEKEEIRLIMSRHIPKEYISDDYVLIEVHKKISVLSSSKEVLSLKDELTDRFGEVPLTLMSYMYSKLAENLVNKMNFERTEITENSALFVFSTEDSKNLDAMNVFKKAYEISPNFNFYYKFNKIHIIYNIKKKDDEMGLHLSKFLEGLDEFKNNK